jgi:predicted Zn-dependent protease
MLRAACSAPSTFIAELERSAKFMKTIFVLLFLCYAVHTAFGQSDAIRQFQQSAYEASLSGSKTVAELTDVWLIPMNGVPSDYVTYITKRLKEDTKLVISTSVQAAFSDKIYFEDKKQIKGEVVLEELGQVIGRLSYSKSNAIYILIAADDLNDMSDTKRFLFALNNSDRRRAIISIARMRLNPDGPEEAPILTKIRLYKMVKKQIGEMYYGYKRSNDLNSVMYSPIMGMDDLDIIGSEY